MASLFEHAERIEAAIKAAQDDGFTVRADVFHDESVELDIWEGRDWITVFHEDF